MLFTNGTLEVRKVGMIEDHGVLIPDYSTGTWQSIGRFSIQPTTGAMENERATGSRLAFTCYGDLTGTEINASEEIKVVLDDGTTYERLTLTEPPQRWATQHIGLPHQVIRLSYKELEAST